MKTDDRIREEVRSALDRRLSGVTEPPGSQQRVLRLVRGEDKIVKKKISAGLVLVMVLLMATMAAAFATGGFGLLDFKKDQANNTTFIEHIVPVGQTFADDYLTLTVNEAVFNGATLSFTMDMAAKDDGDPVYVLPTLTAEVNGETLTTTFQTCMGGFNGVQGFWLPEMDPRMPGGTQFGAEALLLDASGEPYGGDASDVRWHLSFQILHPNWPVTYAPINLPADDSSEVWTEDMDNAYYRQFADAYEDKRILLSDTGSLIDYVEQQLYVDGLLEDTDFFVAMRDKLTHCDAFTVADCPVITFSTEGVAKPNAAIGQVFDFAEGWHAEITDLRVTFDRVACGMHITHDDRAGDSLKQLWGEGDYWTFAILAEGATTTPYTSSEGMGEDGNYDWEMTVSLSAPTSKLTFVPCHTMEEVKGEPSPDGYVPMYSAQAMVFQQQAPCTEEQARHAFSIGLE